MSDIASLLRFLIICASIAVCFARWSILEKPKEFVIRIIPSRYPYVERFVGELLYCAQCIGFWIGILLSIYLEPTWINMAGLDHIVSGAVSSFTATLFDRAVYGKYNGTDS